MEDIGTFCERRMRLILIGKTGAGKSATGNTIMGAEVFKSQIGVNSETKECGVAITKRGEQEILVMDTPGLCDTDGQDSVLAQRITQSLFAVAPGPHAVLLVLRCDARFTDQEVKVFNVLKHVFGEKMTSYMIVIFVGKDELDRKNVNFDTQLQKSGKLQSVLQEADNRYVLFNNEGSEEEKNRMVFQLMQKVQQVVVKNGGGCFRHRISHELDQTMSKMVSEEIRERTGEIMPVISEEGEYRKPKRPAPKPPQSQPPPRGKAKQGQESANKETTKQESNKKESSEPRDEDASETAEEAAETAEDDVSHADQQARNRKQEVHDLKKRGTVKDRLQQFDKPPPSPEVEYRQRTPIHSPRSSLELKETRGAAKATAAAKTSAAAGEKGREPGEESMQTESREATEMSPPQSPMEAPSDAESPDSDVVCHWRSDDSHLEEVLDKLQHQLVTELRTSEEEASFVYEVPDKPGMSLADKQRLVEDALRKKIINHPEELNDTQRQEMDKAVKTVGGKIKEGMTKFAVKAIDQCRLM